MIAHPWHDIPIPVGEVLQPVPRLQQLRAVAAQLAGQLGGGDALGEAADDQGQLPGPPLGAVQDRPGEGVEDAVAVAAAIIARRGAMTPSTMFKAMTRISVTMTSVT